MSTCSSALTVANDLAYPLRLTFLPDADPTSFELPASQRWLAPRQSHSLALPASGWLVGERCVWRDVLGVRTLTHVVRRAANTSVLAESPASPLPPLRPPASESRIAISKRSQGWM